MMGSSYRNDLRNGSMRKWEDKLRNACDLVREVISEVWECAHDGDQFDNSADDGALAEKLGLAVRFITEELPKRDEQAEEEEKRHGRNRKKQRRNIQGS